MVVKNSLFQNSKIPFHSVDVRKSIEASCLKVRGCLHNRPAGFNFDLKINIKIFSLCFLIMSFATGEEKLFEK